MITASAARDWDGSKCGPWGGCLPMGAHGRLGGSLAIPGTVALPSGGTVAIPKNDEMDRDPKSTIFRKNGAKI